MRSLVKFWDVQVKDFPRPQELSRRHCHLRVIHLFALYAARRVVANTRLTVTRVVDPGKTALEPTLVTATISSRLASFLRLSCRHNVGYKARGKIKVPSASSGLFHTGWSECTPSTPATLSAAGALTSFTPISAKSVKHWSFHSPIRAATVRKNTVDGLN